MLRISIVTVTLNSERYLADALRSVCEQDFGAIEHVVIDGGSSDRTLQIIADHRDYISYFKSEPDDGISDAFNKGIRACTGELIGIVSADDALLPGTLAAVAGFYAAHGQPDVVHGDCVFLDPSTGERFLSRPDASLRSRFRGQPLRHGAVFVRREAYQKWGLFDTHYKCAMDYDLVLRFIGQGARFGYLSCPLALVRLGGVNNRRRNLTRRESREIALRHGCSHWKANLYYADKVLRDAVKSGVATCRMGWITAAYRKCFGRTKVVRRTNRLVAISGIDGAGKTTQIARLCDALRSDGVAVERFWARGGYTPLFSAAKRAARMLHPRALPPPGNSVERARRLGSPSVRRAWLALAIFDLILCYGIRLRWRTARGVTVVCDRYLDDTRLDFRRNFPQERFERWILWRLLERITPKPQAAFLLRVPVEESCRRSRLKNEPFPDSEETVAWRLAEYDRLALERRWIVIDCMEPVAEVQRRIREACGA